MVHAHDEQRASSTRRGLLAALPESRRDLARISPGSARAGMRRAGLRKRKMADAPADVARRRAA